MNLNQLLRKVVGKWNSLVRGRGEGLLPLLSSVDRAGLFSSDRLLRLGTAYGGWIIPVDNGLTKESLCYCAGAGEDISFECALVERFHCRVRVIDPTPRAIQHFDELAQTVRVGGKFPVNNSAVDFYSIDISHLDKLEFLPVGLADKDTDMKFFLPQNPAHVSCSVVNLQKTAQYFTAPCLRLPSIMSRQRDGSIDLLKLDIEGAEYGVIEDMVASGLLPRLLLIEFDEAHTPLDGKAPGRIRKHIALLTQSGMRCIAVEGSNATFVKAS